RSVASDIDVYLIVRVVLEVARPRSRMGESRLRSAEPGPRSGGVAAGVQGIGHAYLGHRGNGDEDVPVVLGPVAGCHEERIRGAVWQRRLGEGRRNLVLIVWS